MDSVAPQATSLFRATHGAPGARVRPGADSAIVPFADTGELDTLTDRWWSLADGAREANVFYEPWQLIPALDNLAPRNAGIEIAVGSEGGELDGLVPIAPGGRYSPRWLKSVWTHLHCMDCTPLVRAGREDAYFSALFSWLQGAGVRVLRWPTLRMDGPLGRNFLEFLDRTGRAYISVADRDRPIMVIATDDRLRPENLHLSRGRRRGLTRRRRRLEEMGELVLRSHEGVDVPDTALPCFIDLEAGGWKGRAGTAFARRPHEQAFLEAALRRSVRRGSAYAHSLELNGRPIAMTLNYRSGAGLWAFKTAHDERFRSCAPGILLEVLGNEAAFADPGVLWLDSCSDSENALLSQLWPDRRAFADLFIAVDPQASGWELRMAVAAEKAWRAARGTAKRIYHASR